MGEESYKIISILLGIGSLSLVLNAVKFQFE